MAIKKRSLCISILCFMQPILYMVLDACTEFQLAPYWVVVCILTLKITDQKAHHGICKSFILTMTILIHPQ